MTELVQVRTYRRIEKTVTAYIPHLYRRVRRTVVHYVPAVAQIDAAAWDSQLEPEPMPQTFAVKPGHIRIAEQSTQRIVDALREHGPMDRRQLCERTGLDRNTIGAAFRRSDDIRCIAREGTANIYGLEGQTYTPRHAPLMAMQIQDVLREHGPMPVAEIARRTGLSRQQTGNALRRHDDLFAIVERVSAHTIVWGLVEEG